MKSKNTIDDAIHENANVIKFSCELSDHPEVIIKVICDSLEVYSRLSFDKNAFLEPVNTLMKLLRYDLLQDIIHDLPEIARPLFSVNQSMTGHLTKELSVKSLPYIMFLDKRTSANEVILINGHFCSITKSGRKRIEVVFEWLKSLERNHHNFIVEMYDLSLRIKEEMSTSTRESSKSTLVYELIAWSTESFGEALEIIKELQKSHCIYTHKLLLTNIKIQGDKQELVLETINFGKKLTFVEIFACALSESGWKHLTQNIQNSKHLKNLSISHCNNLQLLNLSSHFTLSNLGYTSGDGLANIEILLLADMRLGNSDVVHLFKAIANEKFPKLQSLNLLGNNLRDKISYLIDCYLLPPFHNLNLHNTQLSKRDLQALSELFRRGHLRTLHTLSLGSNSLTNSVATLLSPHYHPGFSNLEDLNISYCDLGFKDLTALSNGVQSNKLPAL